MTIIEVCGLTVAAGVATIAYALSVGLSRERFDYIVAVLVRNFLDDPDVRRRMQAEIRVLEHKVPPPAEGGE